MLTTCEKSFKKAALVGLGLSDRVKEVIREFEKKGEGSQSKEALRLKKCFDSLEKREHALNQKMDDLKTRLCGKIRFPTRDDIERLDQKITDLSDRFRQWEEAGKTQKKPSA